MVEAKRWDNGGRRSGCDNRQFSYSVHVPERRSGRDRRRRPDRRCWPDRRGHGKRLGSGNDDGTSLKIKKGAGERSSQAPFIYH